jgi:hypothetical protein
MREKKAYLDKFLNESGYIREICTYLQRQGAKNCFVLGTMTVLDFLFLESCHYMLGMFNTLDEKRICPITHMLRDFFSAPQEPTLPEFKYLETVRDYLAFIYTLPFYAGNREYLESFSIISETCGTFSEQRVKGLRKMWSYNKAFVQ